MTMLTWGLQTFIIRQTGPTGSALCAGRTYETGDTVLLIAAADVGFQPIQLINHSCVPNCTIHRTLVIASEKISPNEEITIDYRQVQFSIEKLDFDCLCGRTGCCGHISVGVIPA